MAMQQFRVSVGVLAVLSAVAVAILAPLSFEAGWHRASAESPLEFSAWRDSAAVHWKLTVPPGAWRHLSHGEPFDLHHQELKPETIQNVSSVIDHGLVSRHLCPGAWTMSDVSHFDDGHLTFEGTCNMSASART